MDPRNQGDQSLAELPELPPTPRVLTGGGGYHYFFRKPPGEFKSGKLAQGIDIKADGGYVAAVPSAHISGVAYRWDQDASITSVPLAELPEWITLESLKPRRPSSGRVVDGFLGAAFEAAGWLGKPMGRDRTAALCPWQADHTTGGPRDGSTIVFAPADGHKLGWGHCSHSHCQHRTQQDWIDALPEDAKTVARERLHMDPGYTPRVEVPILAPSRWEDSLIHDSKGKLTRDAGNVVLLLANLPELAGCLAFDQFHNYPVWLRQPPPLDGVSLPELGKCDDTKWTYVQQILAKLRGVSFAKDAIFDGLIGAALEQPFHPVRDYLTLLHWDQIPRVARWLHTYLGVEDTPYSRLVSQWFLIGAVARVFEPGCKLDSMFILEGPQGIGKSTALRILGRGWFCDTTFDINNKDAYLTLRGQWIIEIPEMVTLLKADALASKAFLTSPVDTYRAPYRRDAVSYPRQCVFAGTSNLHQYLADETGGRRYHPVACGTIDTVGLARDVDMLWAEALHMYRSGVKWWPVDQEEADLCTHEQTDRYVGDEWEGIITDYLTIHTLTKFTTADILRTTFNLLPGQWNRGHEMRVAKCLKHLGYHQRRTAEKRFWCLPVIR